MYFFTISCYQELFTSEYKQVITQRASLELEYKIKQTKVQAYLLNYQGIHKQWFIKILPPKQLWKRKSNVAVYI